MAEIGQIRDVNRKSDTIMKVIGPLDGERIDKNGKVIYKKTGFLSEGEKKQQKEIETLIDARLTK